MTIATHLINKMSEKRTALAEISLVLTGSLLIAASAQVKFYLPNTPVPVTLQTLAVLLIGAVLGCRRGMAAAATYVTLGSLGLPLFAGMNGGALALLGPTGGYLFGFVLAAGLVGWLAERKADRRLTSSLPMFLAGLTVIFLCGSLWLSQFVGGFGPAISTGILPFLAGDAVKMLLAAFLLPAAWRLVR